MWLRRVLVIAGALLIALAVQVAFLGRLHLPGAVPDLVLVTVVAIALAYGPVTGAVSGFAAGLLLDLAPPATGIIGLTALIGMAVGFITGVSVDPRDRTIFVIMALVGGSTGGAVLVSAGLMTVFATGRVDWAQVPALALTAGLYGVLLAPLVIPAFTRVVRRVTPEIAA